MNMQKLEQVLDQYVRPQLARHQGGVQVAGWEDGILRVRLTGMCSGCPSAQLTTEELIKDTVIAHLPEVKDVVLVTGVSEQLLQQARDILQGKGLPEG